MIKFGNLQFPSEREKAYFDARLEFYKRYIDIFEEWETSAIRGCILNYGDICKYNNPPDKQKYISIIKKLKNELQRRKPADELFSAIQIYQPLCSPSFIHQANIQLEQRLNQIGIGKYKDNEKWRLCIELTYYSNVFTSERETTFFDDENGSPVLYTQAAWHFDPVPQSRSIKFPERTKMYNKFDRLSFFQKSRQISPFVEFTCGLLWVKCSFPNLKAGQRPDFAGEFDEKNVKFEIIDYVPDKFPKFENLSEEIKSKIKFIFLLDSAYLYFDRVYDPAFCIEELKMTHDKIVSYYERKKARAKTKKVREVFPVGPGEIQNYPDLIFNIYLKNGNSESASEEIEDAITNLDEKIRRKHGGFGFEAISVDATADNQCQLVIDFGMCETDAVDKVIDTLSTLGLGIEKVVIE